MIFCTNETIDALQPVSGTCNIDVSKMVNQLRKDRANMIDDFNTYKLLFRCLGYYGLNRHSIKRSTSRSENGVLTQQRKNDASASAMGLMNERQRSFNDCIQNGIEYVMYEDDDVENNIFTKYDIEERGTQHHDYTNINEMSEYI